MDSTQTTPIEVVNLICSLSRFERNTNEKIGELQRLQNELSKGQHDLVRFVISIDKQQQRLVHQMNFLNRMADKLSKNSDTCKELQARINEKLNTVSCIENMITDDFVYVRNEIQTGNKAVLDSLTQTKEGLSQTEKHFFTFSSSMHFLQNLILERIAEMKKELNAVERSTDETASVTGSATGSSTGNATGSTTENATETAIASTSTSEHKPQ